MFDRVGERGSGDTTMVYRRSLEAVLNMSLRYACFVDEAFSGKEDEGFCLQMLECWIIS